MELTFDPADAATASTPAAPTETGTAARGRIDAVGVSQHAGRRQILHEVSLSSAGRVIVVTALRPGRASHIARSRLRR
jgi:hypothetical protein